MTQPAQPGLAPPGGKSGAWDHSFPLTLTCHASASPQLQPPISSNPPSPPAAQQPCHCSPVAACLLATRSHSLSRSRHPLTDTSAGRLTETRPPTAPLTPPVPGPCAPHHVVSARLAPQPFSGSTQPSCWAIGSLFLPGFRIITTYNPPACLSSLERQRCTLRG